MLHAGLTGGVGSGKSLAAAEFARLGAVVLDADKIARELLSKGTSGARLVAATFGAPVLAPGGEVDRAALARLVFSDDASRRRLDGLLHPLIVARRRELLEQIKRTSPPDVIVVTEAALIFEAGTRGEFDRVILVTAPEAVRRARLAARGWGAAEIEARIRSQWDDARKRPLADYVIDNGGGLEELKVQVSKVWAALKERAKRG
jgi:dephospho-CoA kinase